MQDIALSAEVIELVGKAALPVVEALDAPIARDKVARASRPALDELCARADVPREVHAAARSALTASRAVVSESDGQAYARFLRATHELLILSGLPAPCELAADGV